jgi:hypothetical protein
MARSRRVEIRFTLVHNTQGSEIPKSSLINIESKHENSAAHLRTQAAANRETPTLPRGTTAGVSMA